MQTKREKLEAAGLISPDASLSYDQEQALESLSDDEVDSLASIKGKLQDSFADDPGHFFIITHFRQQP